MALPAPSRARPKPAESHRAEPPKPRGFAEAARAAAAPRPATPPQPGPTPQPTLQPMPQSRPSATPAARQPQPTPATAAPPPATAAPRPAGAQPGRAPQAPAVPPSSAAPSPAAPAAKPPSPLDRFVSAAKGTAGAVTGAVARAGADAVARMDGAVQQAKAAMDPSGPINRLHGTDDTATFSGTALASARVANPLTRVPAGPQVSYGFDATVTQTQPQSCGPPGYNVQFGKNEAGGLGTVFGAGGEGRDKAVLGGEVNIATADRVTTTFTSKEDAARAVSISGHAALAQSIRDLGGVLDGSIPNPRNPLTGNGPPHQDSGSGIASSVLGAIARPVANAVADMVQPSAADTQFMRDHVTSYSTVLSGTARETAELALAKFSGKSGEKAPGAPDGAAPFVPGGAAPDMQGGKSPELKGELTMQPRLLEQARITRTVDLPPGGGPGTLSYSVGTDISADMKERATAIGSFSNASGLLPVANVADLGKASLEAKVSFGMTQQETDATRRSGGNTLPEVAMAGDGRLGNPASASVKLDVTVPTQNPLLPYRTDQTHFQATATLDNPRGFGGDLVRNVLNGRLGDSVAQAQQQGRIQIKEQTLDRDGHTVAADPSISALNKFSFGVGALVTVGNDHVTSTRSYDSCPGAPADCAPAQPAQPQARQMVVLPREGVNVRAQPSVASDRLGIVQSGSFLQADGHEASDASGRRWVSVSGTDVHDQPTRGWVDSEFLQAHERGAMDATGRIDPDLARRGTPSVAGRDGDTVWDLAQANGKDPRKAVEINRDHIIDPNLIFSGDTIYMPR